MLSDSSTFLKFWLTDSCRQQVISLLPKPDLANLRLVCHDFSTRCAPTLFEHLDVNFKTSTFTRPSRLAALDRLGSHVKHLTFKVAHTSETLLPPLIHPETGEELNFTYTPQTGRSQSRQAKYGDEDITELLIHQYPPLFHAATNVPAFVRGFSCFANLARLEISCPGSAADTQSRRSTIDFALVSLRIAIERNCLSALDTMTISPIHSGGLLALSPLTGCGATPASAKKWACIKHLSIAVTKSSPPRSSPHQQNDPNKLLTSYLATFQRNLLSLRFAWLERKGPLPLQQPVSAQNASPTHHHSKPGLHQPNLCFPRLTTLHIQNAFASSSDVRAIALRHASTLQTFELTDVDLTEGSWEEAFAPLLKPEPRRTPHKRSRATHAVEETADIPIMFAPSSPLPPPTPPKVSPARSQTRPQLQRVHPSQRSQIHVRVQEPKPDLHHRAAAGPALVNLPAAARKAVRDARPAQAEKKGGILSRVARGVKRTFGG